MYIYHTRIYFLVLTLVDPSNKNIPVSVSLPSTQISFYNTNKKKGAGLLGKITNSRSGVGWMDGYMMSLEYLIMPESRKAP